MLGGPLWVILLCFGLFPPDVGLSALPDLVYMGGTVLATVVVAGIPVRAFVMSRRGAALRRVGRRTSGWLKGSRSRRIAAALVAGVLVLLGPLASLLALYAAWTPPEVEVVFESKEACLQALERSMARTDFCLLLAGVGLTLGVLVFSTLFFVNGLMLVAARERQ